MEGKRRYKAVIAGKPYTIVGSRSTQHLNAVTELVNQQLRQLEELAPELSVADRCVLMALNAVSDQLVKEQTIVELEEQIKRLKQADRGTGSKSTEQVPFTRKK